MSSLRRSWATTFEPRIPWNGWFTWRIKRQMKRMYEFEQSVLDHQKDQRWLTNFETKRFSQNGEDGILHEICERLDLPNGYLVEIGASDGTENCTHALVEDGWSGLWIEGDEARAENARSIIADKPVTVANAFVRQDNIVELFQTHEVPTQFDLLVIDIDGNDWYVLQQILRNYKPTVIALEYNAAMGLRNWVMPYNADHTWAHDRWHGASLASFTSMLEQFDMTLVGTDTTGVNAFYVQSQFAAKFPQPGDVRAHYSPPRHLLPFGHPWQHDTTETTPLPADVIKQVSIANVQILNNHTPLGFVDAIVEVKNDSDFTIRSSGEHPVHLAAWWGDADARLQGEPERFTLLWPIHPGSSRPIFVRLPFPRDNQNLCLDLVQEGVSWFSEMQEKPTYTHTFT